MNNCLFFIRSAIVNECICSHTCNMSCISKLPGADAALSIVSGVTLFPQLQSGGWPTPGLHTLRTSGRCLLRYPQQPRQSLSDTNPPTRVESFEQHHRVDSGSSIPDRRLPDPEYDTHLQHPLLAAESTQQRHNVRGNPQAREGLLQGG